MLCGLETVLCYLCSCVVQVLRKRDEENTITKSQQKRKITRYASHLCVRVCVLVGEVVDWGVSVPTHIAEVRSTQLNTVQKW